MTAVDVARIAEVARRAGVSMNGSGELSLHTAHPTLDGAAFHGLAGKIVRTLEPHSEADPAALLVTTLAIVGAMAGAGPHAVADGTQHPGRIWALIVGNTSKSRKGSSWAQGKRVPAGADRKFMSERVLGGFGSGEAVVDACAPRAGQEEPHDPRLLVVESEFARILAVSRREGSTLSTLLRQAWDGGRLQVRSRGGTAVAEGAHLVVIGHITKPELLARVAESDIHGGLLNRFLIVEAERSKLLPSGGNLDDGDLADLIRSFVLSLQHAHKVGIIRRTPAAEEYWTDLYERLADDEPGGLLGAVIARDSAQVLRLSVAYTLLDQCHQIDVPHVMAAEAVWNYCRTSAALIFGERTGDNIADRLLLELQSAGSAGLTSTEVSKVFGRNVNADRIEVATNVLISKGLLTKETKKNTTRGRPSTVLRLTKETKDTKEVDPFVSNERTKEIADHLAPSDDINDKEQDDPAAIADPGPTDDDFDRYFASGEES